jgi:hypothetical protein
MGGWLVQWKQKFSYCYYFFLTVIRYYMSQSDHIKCHTNSILEWLWTVNVLLSLSTSAECPMLKKRVLTYSLKKKLQKTKQNKKLLRFNIRPSCTRTRNLFFLLVRQKQVLWTTLMLLLSFCKVNWVHQFSFFKTSSIIKYSSYYIHK